MEAFFVWLLNSVFKPVFWFQPCFYALHGWLATEMALWMLFHPYEAKLLPGTRIPLPFTPGIFPRGRDNLFRSIARTVTDTLLTESDIQQQAEKLISEEALIRWIEALLDSIEREMRNTEQIRRIYRYGEEVLPDLLSGFVDGMIVRLEQERGGKSAAMLSEWIGQGLTQVRLNYQQAEFMTDVLFSTLLTPSYIRKLVTEGLTEGNILVIEKTVSQQMGGIKGFLVRFMGVEQMLTGLREHFRNEPDISERQITEILDRLEVRERLAERIARFSFADLPVETQVAVQQYLATLSTELLVDHHVEIRQAVAKWSQTGSRAVINRALQMNFKRWLNEKRPDVKREVARFLDRYLRRELGVMINRILPVLNIGQMIVEKLDQFSNEQLESLIYGLCRRELRWLAFLGAFLGFWLGLVSNLIHYFLPDF